MKKIVFVLAGLLIACVINAQSLDEIVKKYSAANNQDKVSAMSTVKITGKMSMMGMDMPMEMWMKNPNKIKSVTNFNGQEIVQVFDGEKGFMINPMAGSNVPVEMTPEQLKDVIKSNLFQNSMADYLKNGKLTLEGEDNVSGKPVFKLKVDLDGVNSSTMFIDKSTYLLLKNITNVNQGGMAVTVESFPTDYTETSGILLPMKTTTSAAGMEIVTTFTKVEVDIPIDDSVFKIK